MTKFYLFYYNLVSVLAGLGLWFQFSQRFSVSPEISQLFSILNVSFFFHSEVVQTGTRTCVLHLIYLIFVSSSFLICNFYSIIWTMKFYITPIFCTPLKSLLSMILRFSFSFSFLSFLFRTVLYYTILYCTVRILQLLFPLNILLFPVSVAEYLLMWAVNSN